eukprot:g2292.t1
MNSKNSGCPRREKSSQRFFDCSQPGKCTLAGLLMFESETKNTTAHKPSLSAHQSKETTDLTLMPPVTINKWPQDCEVATSARSNHLTRQIFPFKRKCKYMWKIEEPNHIESKSYNHLLMVLGCIWAFALFCTIHPSLL